MRHQKPTSEHLAQLRYHLNWFDSQPNKGWILDRRRTKRFLVAYKALVSPSHAELYFLKPTELRARINSSISRLLRFKPHPRPSHADSDSLIEHVLTIVDDELDLSNPENRYNALFALVFDIKVRTVNMVSLLRFGEWPSLLAMWGGFDDDTYLNLIKLDPVFLTTESGQMILRRAEMDPSLKRRIAEALSPDRKFWSVRRERRTFIFLLLYKLGIPGTLTDLFLLVQEIDPDEFSSQDAFERAYHRARKGPSGHLFRQARTRRNSR